MADSKKAVTRTHEGQSFAFSSYSTAGDNCVGLARSARAVAVLDSKDEYGPLIEVPTSAWTKFVRSIKA
ncbi:DUF397 domain-containing protein [Streptomyces sp. SID3212]|nr:DUF397 domain-containing protein [Streptomyces sp. SID3212]